MCAFFCLPHNKVTQTNAENKQNVSTPKWKVVRSFKEWMKKYEVTAQLHNVEHNHSIPAGFLTAAYVVTLFFL